MLTIGLAAGALLALAIVSGSSGAEKPAAKTEDPKPWAYRLPAQPDVPAVKQRAWARNPIDAFVAARLEAEGLVPAAEASRPTLIRRLSFDLTGLPPTPQEVDAFVNDQSPDAYEKVVDRLLASPRYGERWALYWLDLVRYAESDGFKADDIRPAAWRYRDYVIRALNADTPYDRFIREQLAGDELFPNDPEAVIATAFNRHFPEEYNARNLEQRRQEILNDMTDTTAQVFLGLTVGCARCHDHKFDPITQKDYYRLQAFFAAYWARDQIEIGQPEELNDHQQQQAAWEAKTAALRGQIQAMEEPYRQKLVARNKYKYPKAAQEAFDTPIEQRTPLQFQLADLIAKQLQVGAKDMAKVMKQDVRKEWEDLGKQMAAFDRLKPQPLQLAMGITDVGPVAPATHLLVRGDWKRRGEELAPGFLSAIDDRTAKIPTPRAGAKTTGRRAALAAWLTQPDHPLTARVMMNRLWQHHFGRGIVGTPSDFGEQGEPPTHPELLDWLAREFVARGWSLKAMHRLMVTSATYRQSNHGDAATAKADPDSRLLGHMNRRRLEGEALRDAMLAVSGLLNLKMAGPSIFPELPAELGVPRGGWPVSADATERNRRSVYVFVKRNLRFPLFGAFDAPDSNETCARRHVSTNAPQALMLLNGKTALDVARSFAGRVLRETTADPGRLVEHTYRLALGRLPDAGERQLATDFLTRESTLLRQRMAEQAAARAPMAVPAEVDPALAGALVDLCHVLLNVNEFAYVD
jgi:hypothetical protein